MLPAPLTDDDVPAFWRALGLPGLVDVHVHVMPQRVLDKVWAFFDSHAEREGTAWPIAYRWPQAQRLAHLRALGVRGFTTLLYAHKPAMAESLNDWARDLVRDEQAQGRTDLVHSATFHAEDGVAGYVERALREGARCFKVHVQVGGFDPRDPLLAPAWGLLADAGVPVVVHCGNGPRRGGHTGLDVFGEVLTAHPRLRAVLAHAGLPDFADALDLLGRHPGCLLDTTMVGTPFTEAFAPLPPDWAARLAGVADRVVFGSDFPNIPYACAEQVRAVASWAAADARLGVPFLRSVLHDAPARLLGG